MAEEYTKDQLWKLYEVLPKELKEAIFSEETANSIYETCTRNDMEKEKIPEIAKYTGFVLMGLLSPNEFEKTIKERLKLKNDSAKKISLEINHFVFSSVKNSLGALYKIEMSPPPPPEDSKPPKEFPKEEAPIEQTPKKRAGKDVYREPTE